MYVRVCVLRNVRVECVEERRTARDGSEEAVGERREEERAAEHHEGHLVAAELQQKRSTEVLRRTSPEQ